MENEKKKCPCPPIQLETEECQPCPSGISVSFENVRKSEPQPMARPYGMVDVSEDEVFLEYFKSLLWAVTEPSQGRISWICDAFDEVEDLYINYAMAYGKEDFVIGELEKAAEEFSRRKFYQMAANLQRVIAYIKAHGRE